MSLRTRWIAVAGTILLMVASLISTAPPASGQAATPTAVFNPDSTRWRSYYNRPSGVFEDALKQDKENGYIAVDINLENTSEGFRGGATLQRGDGRDWDVVLHKSPDSFEATKNTLARLGYRLVDQDHYSWAGKPAMGGLFIRNSESLSWSARHDMTQIEAQNETGQAERKGWMPIDVDVYGEGGGERYSVVYVANPEQLDWEIRYDLTSQQAYNDFSDYAEGKHLRPIAFDSIPYGTGQLYAAIFIENVTGRHWRERLQQSAQDYENWWYRSWDEGYRLIGFDRFETNEGTRYTGIWIQNSIRPSWDLKDDVNDLVDTNMGASQAPGMSVAIMQDDELKYLRGFGFADADMTVGMDSRHVMRLASVSKSVAGVLYRRLLKEEVLDEDAITNDLVTGLPPHHTHRVWQLISNRGCVLDDDELSNKDFQDEPFDTALEASEQFWDDPLIDDCNPVLIFPDPGYVDHYSTAGYTLAGAAMESAVGSPIDAVLQDWLVGPFDLGTLRSLDIADTSVRRAQMWKPSGQPGDPDFENLPVAPYDVSWKALGGGMESSVLDLVEFGGKLTAGKILLQPQLDRLWNLPDSNVLTSNGKPSTYSHGWNVGQQSGHRAVWKSGSNTGASAYIRIYPDDHLVIAVMANRGKGAGLNAATLGKAIGQMVIDEIDGS